MRKFAVAIALLGAVVAMVAVTPAQAQTAISFSGTSTLPTFPCTAGGCTADFSGTTGTGLLVGEQVSGATITINDFVYSEDNCEVGTAEGEGTISGGGLSATITFTFAWTRVANTATVELEVTGGPGAGSSATAAAAFRTSPTVPTGCTPGGDPNTPVDAIVNGVVVGA